MIFCALINPSSLGFICRMLVFHDSNIVAMLLNINVYSVGIDFIE